MRSVCMFFLLSALAPGTAGASGVTAQLCHWPGGAAEVVPCEGAGEAFTIQVAAESPLRTRIDLTFTQPVSEEEPSLALCVDVTPRWPHCYLDVSVLGADREPVPCTWRAAERNRVLVPVPAETATYFLLLTDPRPAQPSVRADEERTVHEPGTGLRASISRWFDGRDAALSFRFDDSHPTHILTAVPMLREHGFTGTFFINPGSGDYLAHEGAWADCAAVGDQEFANHTMHHSGAGSDEEAEQEIGDAARHIRGLCPWQQGLIAYSEGGGTIWTHARPLREILDRHRLFDAYGRRGISMANVYGGRVEAFRDGLEQAIVAGNCFTALFHQIGESISEENFRALLALAEERRDALWIAGVAVAHKYETERNAAALRCSATDGGGVLLSIECGTDPQLYDQPLTVEVAPPAGIDGGALSVVAADGSPVALRVRAREDGPVILFDIAPVDAEFAVSWR